MEAKCKFYSEKGDFGFGVDAYMCHVDEVKGNSSDKEIKSFIGTHEAGKTNNDVTWLFFGNKLIGFVPKNLIKVFPNLKRLSMNHCNLNELSRGDLKGLEKIEHLSFVGNKLTSLPDDLFVGMKKLWRIYFNGNQIERMSSNLLLPIKETLEAAYFRCNAKINDYFDLEFGVKNDLAAFLRIIDEKCLPPPREPTNLRAEKAFIDFSKFKASGKFSDFTIKVRGKEFKIHKMLFAAQSSVFEKIFTEDAEEVSKTFNKIKNFSDETFESFVDFFYTGKVKDSVNAIEMFELASEFDVPELKVICAQRILDKLDESNAVEVFNIAHRHQSEELKTKSFEIIKQMFPELTDNFMNKLDKVNEIVALKARIKVILEEE